MQLFMSDSERRIEIESRTVRLLKRGARLTLIVNDEPSFATTTTTEMTLDNLSYGDCVRIHSAFEAASEQSERLCLVLDPVYDDPCLLKFGHDTITDICMTLRSVNCVDAWLNCAETPNWRNRGERQ